MTDDDDNVAAPQDSRNHRVFSHGPRGVTCYGRNLAGSWAITGVGLWEGFVKHVDVHFSDRRAAFDAYWGYLSRGGLVLRLAATQSSPLCAGETIVMRVSIGAGPLAGEMCGSFVRCMADGRAVIAFADVDVHDRFLALAVCGDGVDVDAHVHHDGIAEPMRVRNLSEQGCRIDVGSTNDCGLGSDIDIETASFRIKGRVVWEGDAGSRYVMFGDDGAQVRNLVPIAAGG